MELNTYFVLFNRYACTQYVAIKVINIQTMFSKAARTLICVTAYSFMFFIFIFRLTEEAVFFILITNAKTMGDWNPRIDWSNFDQFE